MFEHASNLNGSRNERHRSALKARERTNTSSATSCFGPCLLRTAIFISNGCDFISGMWHNVTFVCSGWLNNENSLRGKALSFH